ncbi:MAG: recombinase family protein, partial [Clostridia bacterium]|nr:recombinase family protein [Clostridia bacterium]
TQAGYYSLGCRNPLKWVKADPVEGVVWDQVKGWLNDPEALAREIRQKSGEKELREELERIGRHLAEVERGRDNIRGALAAGLLDLDPKTARALAELKNREKQLAARKSEIEITLRQFALVEAKFKEVKRQAAEFLSRLDELSFEQKKTLVRTLVRQVTVTGRGKAAKVTVYANFTPDIAASVKEAGRR